MTRNILYTAFLVLLLALLCQLPNRTAQAAAEQGDRLEHAWELFLDKAVPRENSDRPSPPPDKATFAGPGRAIGAVEFPGADWKYRSVNYELYFDSAPELARSVYSLALLSGDIDNGVSLERFERGVQGFHYSVAQLSPWLQAALDGGGQYRTPEEGRLANWLLADGVLEIRAGKVVPGRSVRHVSAAAAGKKRSLEVNLRHERLHVLWDEDGDFRESRLKAWQALSEAQKDEARKELSGYAKDNEAQLIEEWAVFKAEKLPEAERKKLVGL